MQTGFILANSTGYPGFKHIPDRVGDEPKDFSEIIEHAKRLPAPTQIESGKIGGFAHAQVFALADKIVEAVNQVPSRNSL